ncbi:aminotransferase class V-fold PLP-dependent enzyme [Pseudomonas atacamensis]|uniref:Aminotransferase class V-fold PLP-dependent enzyme n=1 Tax=Pseudomonas atacamensis TaxID=2565368 RepID=A0AAQ2HYB2_9PSED|nr:aminotransferase class V-fold PLP-dependent enzyme [Pseudomonas atacamensis]THF25797.1 aminotransferase class V-fold PLP-dependent enzyme [Pseudomonas atacamensis]
MKNNNCVLGALHCNYRDDFATVIAAEHSGGTVFLDNAATTQKPKIVVEEICNFYRGINSGEQRGVQTTQNKLILSYERSRKNIAAFINADDSREIVFSNGVTESINFVANSFITPVMKGGEIIITEMEHHSNILPLANGLCKI